jgi:hypothetical protein
MSSNLTKLEAMITRDGLMHRATAAGQEISFPALQVLTIMADTWIYTCIFMSSS